MLTRKIFPSLTCVSHFMQKSHLFSRKTTSKHGIIFFVVSIYYFMNQTAMENKKIKGINVKKLSFSLIIVEVIFFVASIICALEVYANYKRVDQITDKYIRIQSEFSNLKSASDYLTDKSRQYILTGNLVFAGAYYTELNENQRRENAVVTLKEMITDIGEDTVSLIDTAYEQSNLLIEDERHAMALTASLLENPTHIGAINDVMAYHLPESEYNLSLQDRKQTAYSLVFGEKYSEGKAIIRQNINSASNELLSVVEVYKIACAKRYYISFILLLVLLALSAITFGVITFTLIKFILVPLSVSIESIKSDQRIPSFISYELNYLASTYNDVFEENEKTKLDLQSKAERDELTGLLNRSAFNNLVSFYKKAHGRLALLVIDVDHFKNVNDTCGHAKGDDALKRIAVMLEENFRTNDFPIRYGGDEFVVIMAGLGVENKDVIEQKIDHMNKMLQSPEDGEPSLSISVGVAFSESGFAENLFEKADKALYQAKENGRCGYAFAE